MASCGETDATAASRPGASAAATTSTLAASTVAAPPTTAPVEPVATTTAPPRGETQRGTPATLVAVVDGDTLRVRLDSGEIETLRMVGIDAPETGECLGAEAADELQRIVGSGGIGLTSDVSDRDRFGRLLRHVWTGQGRLAGEELVRSGYAIARAFPPDVGETARLADAQAEAETAGRGLWAPEACGAATGSGVVIADIEYDAPGDDSLNLNAEWIELRNGGVEAAHLTGWVVKDESASHRYGFPAGFVLEPGASVRIRTGCGEDSDTDLHWCNESSAIWNNSGDTGFLLDPNGNIVATLRYGNSSSP